MLRDKRIVVLDLAMMVGAPSTGSIRGTHQGGHERSSPGKNHFVHRRVHTLVGAAGEGAIDASKSSSPPWRVARSSASRPTLDEYRKNRKTVSGTPVPADYRQSAVP